MKKILFLFVSLSLLLPPVILAHSGCCSHHGGVCGCGCCDGTSLSDICAPYYPECSNTTPVNSSPAPYPQSTSMPFPTFAPRMKQTPQPTLISPKPSPTDNPVSSPPPTIAPSSLSTQTTQSGTAGPATTIIVAIIGIYLYVRYKKHK